MILEHSGFPVPFAMQSGVRTGANKRSDTFISHTSFPDRRLTVAR